jgi:hypothetical protein
LKFRNIIGCNFSKLDNKKNDFVGFVGYDPAGPLHLGSLIPLLINLEIMRKYKINRLIISINDVEAKSSRKISDEDIKKNIEFIRYVINKIVRKYNTFHNTKIKINYFVRGNINELWYILTQICSIKKTEQILKESYDRLPLNHLLSILIMCSEFIRVLKNYNIITSYGYEEFIHLKFIERILGILPNKTQNQKLFYIIFLPAKAIGSNKKMSKSEKQTAIYLIPKNEKYLINIKKKLASNEKNAKIFISEFLEIWSKIFSKADKKTNLKELISIVDQLTL